MRKNNSMVPHIPQNKVVPNNDIQEIDPDEEPLQPTEHVADEPTSPIEPVNVQYNGKIKIEFNSRRPQGIQLEIHTSPNQNDANNDESRLSIFED
jgi:hypothetical protein